MNTAELIVVGSGIRLAGQWTEEAISAVRSSEVVLYLVQSSVTEAWLKDLKPSARTLRDCYRDGRDRRESYDEMVERLVRPLREGRRVAAVFYGHPGVFVTPAHEAIARARKEGFDARMLPGISALDCLFADLGLDPAATGCQIHEATDFLVRHREIDPTTLLILLQAGSLGVREYWSEPCWNPRGVAVLAERLLAKYGPDHQAVVYEAAVYPIQNPTIQERRLSELSSVAVSMSATIVLPPLPQREFDRDLLGKLANSASRIP